MVHTSSAYKRIMAQKLRNRGYVSISLGVINSLAQEGATVVGDLARWSTGDIFKTKNSEKVEYATLEEKSIPADGSMVFMPETDQFKDNGITAEDIGDPIRINFNGTYTIKGLTIDFGQNYPTEFVLQTNGNSYTLTNSQSVYENPSLILSDVSYIIIQPTQMLHTNQRLRIRSILMGVGLYFDDSVVQNINCERYVSAISENISYQTHTINIYDVNHQFDVDNPASFMQFLEPMQKVEISVGVDLGNDTIEWVKLCSAYLQSWNMKKNILTLTATDRLSQLKNTYSLGNTIHTRTAYAELEAILQDAGFERDEYEIDTYLQNVSLVNPVPECLHREAIQLVCNATRCVFFEDENGILNIVANFANTIAPVDIIIEDETGTDWTDYQSVFADVYNEYGDLSGKMNQADGHQIFLPENTSEYLSNTGWATFTTAYGNGEFPINPVINVSLPAMFSFHAITIAFEGAVPSSMNISGWDKDTSEEKGSLDVTNPEREGTYILDDFDSFNNLTISIYQTEPNARCYVTKIKFDTTSGYVINDNVLTDNIQSYINEKIRNTRVKVYTFENDEEQKPHEVEDSVYATKALALTGIDKTCENQLISTQTQAQDVADWLALHYKNNTDYSVTYRGEPAIQAGDVVVLTNPFKDINVSVEKTTFSFNGAFSGKLELRRVGYTNEEE